MLALKRFDEFSTDQIDVLVNPHAIVAVEPLTESACRLHIGTGLQIEVAHQLEELSALIDIATGDDPDFGGSELIDHLDD